MDKNLEAELKALTPEQRQIEEGIAAWLAKHDELRRQQVEAATLRAVGEWIVAHPALPGSTEGTVVVELSTIVIEALRAGKMPVGGKE